MENHRRHKSNSSGDKFSFPAMSEDLEFEFELADQLFSNGKFILHTFPVQPKNSVNSTSSRSMMLSRTSSVSSKDSLMSSRSNSINSSSSSSSSCSSARTSVSEASSERRLFLSNQARAASKTRSALPKKESQGPVLTHTQQYYNCYGPSQRWQFIAPVPVLNHRSSSKRKDEMAKRKGEGEKKRKGGRREGFCRRIFGWFVSTCKECHAMEPSKKERVFKGRTGLQ